MLNRKWEKDHCRYYQTAGITICVESDIAFTEKTFHPKFQSFAAAGPGHDTIYVRHHFSLPRLEIKDKGKVVYQKPPWVIHQSGNGWVYEGISPGPDGNKIYQVAVIDHDHTHAEIYHMDASSFKDGDMHSLTAFPTDQILLARVLADRRGCYFHSSGVIFGGKGFLFAGHSEAGKSTVVTNLRETAEILCDDRIIVKKLEEGYRIYGTWSHGDVPKVSPNSAPLKAIFFLKQAKENRLIPLYDKKEIIRNLLALLIKPLVTSVWWEKMLSLVEEVARDIPCYILRFEKNGDLCPLLQDLCEKE